MSSYLALYGDIRARRQQPALGDCGAYPEKFAAEALDERFARDDRRLESTSFRNALTEHKRQVSLQQNETNLRREKVRYTYTICARTFSVFLTV